MHGLVAIAPLPPVPRHDLLTYRVPEPLRDRVRPGVRVRVPLGRQTRTGVVAAFADALPPGELRSIVDVLDADPFLPADLLELCRWTARYYFVSLAEVIATIVPASVPRPSEERALRLARRLSAEEEAALTRRAPARACAYRALTAAPDTQLTSAAARAAGIGAAALRALVAAGPSGGAPVAVGARSAVVAPARRLGLVVVDEEHDAAYKQEEGLRYNARDLAVVRARLAGAVAVLASATPSAESYRAALDGRHRLLTLPERPTAQPLPVVEVVDLRARADDRKRSRLVSEELRRALEANLAAGGQTLVFLNRRGFAVYLQCAGCGAALDCPLCSVTLAWHRAARALVCHHCRHTRRPPATCPACGTGTLEAFGVGTEQIEAALRACYPLAVVDRLDRDAAQRLGAQRRILRDWRAGATDILVGTQMVSKGHDVPGVTLVAVLLADLSLNVPDFRAAERTFQLLVQVAGRAGRGDAPVRVVVQTFRPEHPSVAAAAHHDYAGFMARELDRRRTLGYPPFARLVNLRLDGPDGAAVERAARELAGRMRRRARDLGLGEGSVVGPAPPPL